MDFSRLDGNERLAAIAAVVVFVLGIVSLVNDWGGLMIIPILGALAVLAVLFLPQLSPQTTLPMQRNLALLVAGGAAGLFWVISALTWLDWIVNNLATFDTLQFLVGLVAAVVLAWTAWQAYRPTGDAASPGAPTES